MRGYDYWALGHVHAFEVISQDPFVVYPGNIQGRNIRETGEKGAVLVSVSDGRVTELERLVVDRARFERLDVDVADCGDQNEILRFIESELRPLAAEAGGRPLAALATSPSNASGPPRAPGGAFERGRATAELVSSS